MAHEISSVSGRDEVFVVGQKAWHGLGLRVDNAVTSEEAITLAGLNWRVEQRPLSMPDGTVVPDRVANVRKAASGSDVYLGTVGTGYKILQNSDAFKLFDTIIGEKMAVFQTAGALKDGRKVFMTAKLPGELVVGKLDVTEKYLLLATSHDGSSMCRMFWTPVRVVCQNTLNMALSGSKDSGIAFPHIGDQEKRVEEAVRILCIANKKYQALEEVYNQFARHTLSNDDVESYFKKVLPNEADSDNRSREKTRGEMMNNYKHGKGAEMSFGTLWGAYNGVTEYYDHSRYAERKTVNAETRMESLLFGAGFSTKQKAFDLAYEAVSVSETATATLEAPAALDMSGLSAEQQARLQALLAGQ